MRILRKISHGFTCEQSSFDPRHSLPGYTADSLLESAKTGGYSFHTRSNDPSPWWQVDFGEPITIAAIVIFNREKYRERANSLRITNSEDGEFWNRVFDNASQPEKNRVFGGVDSGPRTVWTEWLTARFIRLSVEPGTIFHLDAVEFYAEAEVEDRDVALADITAQAAGGAAEIARANLARAEVNFADLLAYATAAGGLHPRAAATCLEHFAQTGVEIDERHFTTLGLQTPEAGYAALIRGYLKSSISQAKAAYDTLARYAPDDPKLPQFHEQLLAATRRASEQLIKLIIWDLDDTLWTGTLAEGDSVSINEHRRQLIIQAVDHGIVNSICSKNVHEDAIAKLEQFGLLDYLTAPQIAFKPKGELVKALIKSLQLRETNVLFVDDNPLNLNEVKYYCPDIKVMDATDPETDPAIEAIISGSKVDGGKRHREYAVLARKLADEIEFSGGNEEFLKQSRIKIAIVSGANNFRYARRVEELVNRSNQMNFLKSRIPEGTATYIIGDSTRYRPYSVFVRDRFGSYGLCGFACIHIATKQLVHFAFSCRILDMNVENVVMEMITRQYGPQACEVVPKDLPYIEVADEKSWEFANDMDEAANAAAKDIMIMANCQSGIIAHYIGAAERIDAEEAPHIFTLAKTYDKAAEYATKYKTLIFGIFVDYLLSYWGKSFSREAFADRLDHATAEWERLGATVYILMPPASDRLVDERDGAHCTFADLNDVVVECARRRARVHVVRISDFITEANDVSKDLRHYSRPLIKRIAEHLRSEILAAPAGAKAEEPVAAAAI